MIWYNIRIGLRYLVRQKNISLMNLLGLSIGMTVTILIFYFVNFEMNYDNFHRNSSQIYRIISVNKGTGGTDFRATTPLPLPEAVRADIKDIEMVTGLSLFLSDDEPVMIAGKTFFNLTGYTADSCFLKMFNFPLLTGNPKTIFENTGSVVLADKTAKKLFGDENPLGKELIIGDFSFRVEGILKDLPENSIFKFDLLVSHLVLKKMYPDLQNMWWGGGAVTFVKTFTDQNVSSLKADLDLIPEKYFPDYLKGRESYDIQSLASIHTDNRVSGDILPPVSQEYLYILLAIAIAVLFIACASFVNLSTSQSGKRARETGLRKLAGGGRFQISSLFLGESVTLSLIAVVIAVYLSDMFLPWFNELSQRNISINFANGKIILALLAFGILTGFLSGIWPALIFSRYQPVQILRAKIASRGNKPGIRKGFIITQFLITIVMIITQLFISRQISFMKNHDLGFNEEDLLSVQLRVKDESNRLEFAKLFASVMEREAQAYEMKGVSITENIPGNNFPNRFAVIPEGSSAEDSREMVVTSIDENFSDVFQIPIVSGRALTDTIASDRFSNVIINETAARKLGWDNPVGKKLRFKHEEESLTVIGVIKDMNIRSMQTQIEPVIYRFTGSNWLAGYVTLRIDKKHYQRTIKFISETWEELAPGVPFQYFFIKDKYNARYQDEERLANIVGTFTILAVFLSCLGLFALINWLSIQRTKEIGIRKINGAGIVEVMYLLSSEFIKLVAIAFVISCPVGWYIVHKWLQNFAYKTELSWWIFGLSGIIALGIAILTVSLQTWRAATKNPVEALRYE
ncbi:MAG: ABC transporter permease [Bacteroidales bacterium]|nr:ABC transporter permease [Bacteroidales bacterium]